MNQKLSRWLVLGWLGVAMGQASPPGLRWHAGVEDCEPALQLTEARAWDETTIVIRQNPCVDYEAPLMYLLLGTERALLIDSGASEDPRLTAQLTDLVSRYLDRPDGSRLPLVVAHSHGHQDHRSGDAAFAALSGTTVVPVDGEGMRKFFGLQNWPQGGAQFELGNRRIELVPTPGHHPDHLVFVDSRTRLMFTGDFLLPGRLLVQDIDAYVDSAFRVLEAVNAYGSQYALGAHIEMDTAGKLYASGASFHPDERPVALPFATKDAVALHQALRDFNGFYNRHADYAVVNPIHNLIALGLGILVALVLLVWGVRRLIKRRRAIAAVA